MTFDPQEAKRLAHDLEGDLHTLATYDSAAASLRAAAEYVQELEDANTDLRYHFPDSQRPSGPLELRRTQQRLEELEGIAYVRTSDGRRMTALAWGKEQHDRVRELENIIQRLADHDCTRDGVRLKHATKVIEAARLYERTRFESDAGRLREALREYEELNDALYFTAGAGTITPGGVGPGDGDGDG